MSRQSVLLLVVLLAGPPACSRDDVPPTSRVDTPPKAEPSALEMDVPRRLLEHPLPPRSAAPPSPAAMWKARLGPPLSALPDEYPGPCMKPAMPPGEYARLDVQQEELAPNVIVGPDISGDGIDDVFLSAPAYCMNEADCYYALYVAHGECGHFAGIIIGHSFAVSEERAKPGGFKDLEVDAYKSEKQDDLVALGSKIHRVLYQFDGHAYLPKKRRKCTIIEGQVLRDERCEPWTAWRGGLPNAKTAPKR